MFRKSQNQTVVEVIREQLVEPKTERPLAFRIEQLEERIAPLTKSWDKASPLLM